MNNPTLPVLDITRNVPGEWTGNPPSHVSFARIHSDRIGEGDLFVGLKGENTHGQRFLDDAVERGAVAAVVEEKQPVGVPQFVTGDSKRCLQQMAYDYRHDQMSAYVIGITGSCGKTTVKEMISNLLDTEYDVGRTPGNFNNHLGLPLTLLNQGHGEVLVAEIASNSPGEIDVLTNWLSPHMGVITHIGLDHLEGFGTIENVAREKSSLIAGIPRDGVVVLPGDIPKLDYLIERSAVHPRIVGRDTESDIQFDWAPNGSGTYLKTTEREFYLPFSGDEFAVDASLATAVADIFGIDDRTIETKWDSFTPLSGRGRILTHENCRIIDGSYNANPDSVLAALDRLAEMPGPRFVVLGDMKELGESAGPQHERIGERLSELPNTHVWYVGKYADHLRRGYNRPKEIQSVESIDEFAIPSVENYKSGLVKASHSVGLHKIIDEWTTDS